MQPSTAAGRRSGTAVAKSSFGSGSWATALPPSASAATITPSSEALTADRIRTLLCRSDSDCLTARPPRKEGAILSEVSAVARAGILVAFLALVAAPAAGAARAAARCCPISQSFHVDLATGAQLPPAPSPLPWPARSPDGTLILQRATDRLLVTDSAGSALELAHASHIIDGAVWSPDSQRIAFWLDDYSRCST